MRDFRAHRESKGRMIGEADRGPTETAWELVNYVRTFGKKYAAAVPKARSGFVEANGFCRGAQKKL
jgi:hypothetical protein